VPGSIQAVFSGHPLGRKTGKKCAESQEGAATSLRSTTHWTSLQRVKPLASARLGGASFAAIATALFDHYTVQFGSSNRPDGCLPVSTKTILIVDDDPIQREGLAVVLRGEGYTVVVAADGEEAIAHLKQGPSTDLILLDMVIPPPATDGWRFLEKRKRNPAWASVPILIVTGLEIASAEWAASLGAAGYVKKPVDTKWLFAEIRRCCGLPPA
jgi:CheY-like chemotaxis protein